MPINCHDIALPCFDASSPSGMAGIEDRLEKLRSSVSTQSEAAQTVNEIIQAISARGDEAVIEYMRKWTDPAFDAQRIKVDQATIDQAQKTLDPELEKGLLKAIEHVSTYQKHMLPKEPETITLGGAELGMRFSPVDACGLAVPGGRASYPSSVIMLAVPALVAGIAPEHIHVISPPPTRNADEQTQGDISSLVLATCGLLALPNVYRIGGAQGIAALALGTQSVPRVDFIAGPGNIYTQLAKQQLMGQVGIDGFYGPSEIVVLADASADPEYVAADLLAQAEHDPGQCFLICWEKEILERIYEALARQIPQRQRQTAIRGALKDYSCTMLVSDQEQAIDLANQFAAEHVTLAVKEPEALLERMRHGGEYFLGLHSPVAAGDYYAGPSHCLPTGTTARFASGVSSYTFLKRSGTVQYKHGLPQDAIDAISSLAQAESLDAHAASARVRAGTSSNV